jgi:putative flippase GtrA
MAVHKQLVRYALVGLASNVTIYATYIALTHLGMGPKLAMSLLYGAGVLLTFVLNRKWSFQFGGAAKPALVRYATAYALGYAINFLALILLVDQAGLPHQWVQGVMILVIAFMLFLAQRYWVFPRGSRGDVA